MVHSTVLAEVSVKSIVKQLTAMVEVMVLAISHSAKGCHLPEARPSEDSEDDTKHVRQEPGKQGKCHQTEQDLEDGGADTERDIRE